MRDFIHMKSVASLTCCILNPKGILIEHLLLSPSTLKNIKENKKKREWKSFSFEKQTVFVMNGIILYLLWIIKLYKYYII